MEDKIISIGFEHFVLEFRNDGSPDYNMRWQGSVVEIIKYDEDNWQYQSNESSDETDDRSKARVWFNWSFCWRGVWEGRVYFKDDEYWGVEMDTIPLLWNEVRKVVKEKIKSDNPDHRHFDE